MQINPFDILKNAQKLQEQMGNIQERLGGITVSGSSGAGMVEVELNGRLEVLGVHISSEAMELRDRDMLEDLVSSAFTNAMGKIRETINRELGAWAGIPGMGGFGVPGGG